MTDKPTLAPFIEPRVDPGRSDMNPTRVNQPPRLAPAPPKTENVKRTSSELGHG